MSYTQNLLQLAQEKNRRLESARKYQTDLLKMREELAATQEKVNALKAQTLVNQGKEEAKARNLDKQSEKLEAETLGEIQRQELERKGTLQDKIKSVFQKTKQEISTPSEEEIAKDSGNPSSTSTIPPSSSRVHTSDEGLPESLPIPLTKEQILNTKAPALESIDQPTGDNRFTKAVKEYLDDIGVSEKNVKKAIQKQQKEVLEHKRQVWKTYIEASNKVEITRKKMSALQLSLNELNKNPPLRQQALANVNWVGRISSAIHAALQGYLKGHGVVPHEAPLLLDKLIQDEYNDIVAQYEARKDNISSEFNLLAAALEWDKNDIVAKQAVLTQLYGMQNDIFKNEMASLSLQAENRDKTLAAADLRQEMEERERAEILKLQKLLFESQFQEQGITPLEAAKLSRQDRAYRLQHKKYQQSERKARLEEGKMALQGTTGKREVSIRFRSEKKADKAEDIVLSGREDFNKVKQYTAMTKKIGGLKGLGKYLTSKTSFFTKRGREARSLFVEIEKGLKLWSLTARLKFTGGGNMSEWEQKVLASFFEVKGNRPFRQFTAATRGDFETLFKALKKNAFNSTTNEFLNSIDFRKLDRNEKIRFIADKIGISNKEAFELAGKLKFKKSSFWKK